VYVTWPASPNAGSGVEHIITHAEGTTSILANQNVSLNPAGANLWNSFGRYNLRGGTMYTVSQTNENYSEAGKVFLADAVRWELVSLIAEPPVMISAVSRKMHGDVGVFDINIGGTGGVECRQGGATQVMVVFDKNIQLTTGTTNDVQTTLGTVTSLAAGGTSLTIQLTAAGPGAVTLSFPGVADATNPGAVVTDTLCFRSLPGDVQPSGSINVFDLLAIKGNINQAVTDATFTSDVNADGLINVLDLLVARNGLNTSIPPCP